MLTQEFSNMKKYFLLLFIIVSISCLTAQSVHFGTEVQRYPAGAQFMLTSEFGWQMKNTIHAKIGYNLARRKDFSPYNDLENGGGWGATLGYRRYFNSDFRGFYLGARSDLWGLTIDWEDDLETANPRSGTTNITVLQPTGEIGYLYQFTTIPLAIGLNVSAGWEINIRTEGEQVGEGAIGLLGLRIRYRLLEQN